MTRWGQVGRGLKDWTGDAWHREQKILNQEFGAHIPFNYLFVMAYKYKENIKDIYFVISPGYDEN